jgi:hypothetical protein
MATINYQGDRRFLSYHHRVHFAGFTATTPALQQQGWELSVEQDPYRDSIRLAMRHQAANLRMLTNAIPYMHLVHQRDQPLDFVVQHAASQMHINIAMMGMPSFQPVDAFPQMINHEIRSLDDLAMFATPLARTQEIIVDPHDVQALLERIKELQLPEQERIRERRRLTEAREGSTLDHRPRQVFHAQVLSIAA